MLRECHKIRVWSQGGVHESETEQSGRQPEGKREILPLILAQVGKKRYWIGHHKSPSWKVIQITSFMGKENKNLTLTQKLTLAGLTKKQIESLQEPSFSLETNQKSRPD